MKTTETMLITLGEWTKSMKDSLQQMTQLRAGIREERDNLLPSMNELEARYSLLQRQVEFLNSSIINLEAYLSIVKGDADAN